MALSSLSLPNLVLQLIILLLLVLGGALMKFWKNLRLHPIVLTLATVLNIASVVLVMLPSTRRALPGSWDNIDMAFGLLLVHHSIGLVALAFSVVLVGGWLLSGRKPNGCPGSAKNKKWIMRITFSTWALSLILGIFLYAAYL
ncbi:MAG: hypothetical protein ISF22_01885 [Methanomassiliicoccus sp.]|nr:hypothetical protein [Methanomassiliicoccus sp.]